MINIIVFDWFEEYDLFSDIIMLHNMFCVFGYSDVAVISAIDEVNFSFDVMLYKIFILGRCNTVGINFH